MKRSLEIGDMLYGKLKNGTPYNIRIINTGIADNGELFITAHHKESSRVITMNDQLYCKAMDIQFKEV